MKTRFIINYQDDDDAFGKEYFYTYADALESVLEHVDDTVYAYEKGYLSDYDTIDDFVIKEVDIEYLTIKE